MGLIDTALMCPTSSSWGTTVLSAMVTAIQPSTMGTASTRIILGSHGRAAWRAAGNASVVGSFMGLLMRPSPGSRSPRSHRSPPFRL
ncbi:Uncharacterised protein [Mycobacteroides abscessus subsp. abscessus]|nr:Uncharacterised protein [Mycobacteroides abscessus subsp. abscessus]